LEHLSEWTAFCMLADHVGRHALLLARAREQERERIAEKPCQEVDCILGPMSRPSGAMRFAERRLAGVDDGGVPEAIVIWIERRPGALWAVCRCVNPQLRPEGVAHTIFEGYELEDALESANGALRDDVRVLEQYRRRSDVTEFAREELLKPLERWFFGHEPR